MTVFVLVKKFFGDFEVTEEVNVFRSSKEAINSVLEYYIEKYDYDEDYLQKVKDELEKNHVYDDTDGGNEIIWTIHITNLEL